MAKPSLFKEAGHWIARWEGETQSWHLSEHGARARIEAENWLRGKVQPHLEGFAVFLKSQQKVASDVELYVCIVETIFFNCAAPDPQRRSAERFYKDFLDSQNPSAASSAGLKRAGSLPRGQRAAQAAPAPRPEPPPAAERRSKKAPVPVARASGTGRKKVAEEAKRRRVEPPRDRGPDSEPWDREDIKAAQCMVCKSAEREEELLLCDADPCRNACHLGCCAPPLTSVPDGQWFCSSCAPSEPEAAEAASGGKGSLGPAAAAPSAAGLQRSVRAPPGSSHSVALRPP